MTDKRCWTTADQRTFLDGYVAKYLDVQPNCTYHKFWPPLFQAWFAKFPEPDPKEDDPTDMEIEDDSEPDAASESDAEGTRSAGSKHKKSERKARARKLAKKVFLLFYNTRPLC